MDGGAWPFLVGGVICLVNSDNERDSSLLNNMRNQFLPRYFLMGSSVFNALKQSNNRSVMPLDVRGCTRATLKNKVSPLAFNRARNLLMFFLMGIGDCNCAP